MRIYKISDTDSKRVKLLKKCAQNLHDELMEYAAKPTNPSDFRERHIVVAIYKLNVRIRKAMSEDERDTNQLGLTFSINRAIATKTSFGAIHRLRRAMKNLKTAAWKALAFAR